MRRWIATYADGSTVYIDADDRVQAFGRAKAARPGCIVSGVRISVGWPKNYANGGDTNAIFADTEGEKAQF